MDVLMGVLTGICGATIYFASGWGKNLTGTNKDAKSFDWAKAAWFYLACAIFGALVGLDVIPVGSENMYADMLGIGGGGVVIKQLTQIAFATADEIKKKS